MAAPEVNVTELVKLALRPRYSFAIWLTAVIIFDVPLPDFLRVQTFRDEYGRFLGVVALLAFVVWAVEISIVIGERKRREWDVIAHLDGLSGSELWILGLAIAGHEQTMPLQSTGDNIQSLAAKKMLILMGEPSAYTGFAPFTVPLFLWHYLNKHKTWFLARVKSANPDKATELDKRAATAPTGSPPSTLI